uniref:Polycystin 1 like 1, transient receptor potential channel interacting n=1 Tax=Fundulus heteroclitus TaxID=8078 RepID=A0A3Q2NUX1_FUNHE
TRRQPRFCFSTASLVCATHQLRVNRTKVRAVRIYAERQVYPTNKDVVFLVVTDIPDPAEFFWDFGDSKFTRTSLRTITKRYDNPGSYKVVVAASWGETSVASDVFPVEVQRAVKLSRLAHRASVLRNQTLTMRCRVSAGTNLTFMWSFGDGPTRPGPSTAHHVFHRLGEFVVKVTASNLISSASLSSHVFVVDRACQPPPVKRMGPLKLQVKRQDVIHLGVTFEADVDCDISDGLDYTWTLFGSGGQIIPLPDTDTQSQSLMLPSHLLQYDTYTATARVQVIGSVVYSNYTVTFQVKPSPPVAFIQGGTNFFIDKESSNMVTLDGQKSYDPDFPRNPLSYRWTCKPVSIITSSCFHQDIPTSSPVLRFPTSLLEPKFDQFQFTLTVTSGARSASSEAFLTVASHLTGKVSVFCHQCLGDRVNWDQPFSVSALCEDCSVRSELTEYTWSLYLVNASSKPIMEVPFCYTVDASDPSAIRENPTTSTLTPETSSLHPPVPRMSQNRHVAGASFPASLVEKVSGPKFQPQILYLGQKRTASEESRDESDKLGLSSSEPSQTSVLDHISLIDASGEFPSESSADWKDAFPLMEGDPGAGSDDYDVPYPSVEEGDPEMSAGRLNDAESFNPGDESVFDLTLLNNEGSNLVDPKPSVANQEPTLLDSHQEAVERGLFESYTYTGISSTLVTFRPFSLRPRSMYMLFSIIYDTFRNNLIGRTQLFLKTNPAPEGVACQVQPVEGMELHTPFSIFCSSGQADLEYKYSYSVGGNPPWILYQGRDFQYYFSLPSGDPSDDYEVTIYTEIRSSGSGSATKPCPVTVRVRPSFLRSTSSSSSSHQDPALKLSESLRNLSTLIQLGNPVEIRNFILLLTSVLNRLSQDAEANACAQRHTRNVLICTLCELQGGDQKSLTDNIFILNELLQVTNQVTLMSVRHVASHVRSVSEKLPEVSADQATLHSLINSLSHCLLVVTGCSCTPETPQAFNSTRVSGAGSLVAESRKDSENASDGCAQSPSSTPDLEHGGEVPAKRLAQLGEEILRSAADLMLVRPRMFLDTILQMAHRVETGLMTLLASSQNQSSSIIRSGFTSVHMPAALIQRVFGRHPGRQQQQPCVLRVLTELSRNFYPRDTRPPQHKTTPACFSQLTGPVVDLSLFECSTRRKIHIHPLPEPVNTEMQLPQRNESSQHLLLRGQVSYHNFSISQELLQRAIQVTVVFTPPSSRPFPIMLLFRMFERPTPSMHHLQRIHQWEQNTMRLTLPPSYLNAAGVAHIALLDADFRRVPRRKLQSQQIRYSVTVDSSLCLSWDGQQGTWTRHDCRTHQTDSSPAVTCSCYHLRPLTVFQQQVQSSQDTGPLDPFLSPSIDLTVLGTLAVLLVLYILGLLWSHRADVVSKENQKAHYVSDNDPADPYFYAVCVHTGLCSAARMTAKVYIVLYGADGFSQTKELQVPGCSLFRRNATDTFILSAADSLGPVWGVHIWHDDSGSSPDWYLKQVVVSEVKPRRAEARSWLFVGECWLAVNKGDGRVERMLRVCSEEIHFAKTLLLRFSDFSADFHTWLCVHGCPSPSSFTHTQRLSVCMLLVLGYACANAVIISRTDDQLPFEVGVVDVSVVSVTTGLLSVMVALPVATLTSLLFRLTGNRAVASGDPRANHTKTARGDFQGQVRFGLSSSFLCFFFCFFLLLCWNLCVCTGGLVSCSSCNLTFLYWVMLQSSFKSNLHEFSGIFLFSQLLRARQRARLLRLARPPTPAELRRTRRKRRREALIQETLRDSSLCAVMLLLTAFIISGSSVEQHQSLNEAVKRHFTGYSVNGIKTHEDWWKWTQSILLDSLYQESSQPHVLIGEPVVQKRDFSRLSRPGSFCRSEAASKLRSLQTSSWVGRRTVALKVQFAVYSPAPRLFSSVSLVAERRPDGALLTSASVRSVRVLHSPALRDHVATVCQLLFLFLSLLQASIRASSAAQQGLMGCWRTPCTWLDAVLLAVTLVCYGCFIRRSSMIVDVARLLQTQHGGYVDVGAVANWEQNIRTVWGVILFLLSVKCVALLGLNRTFSSSAAVLSQTLSSLFWLLVSGLTLLLALSSSATLLYAESSWAFSSLPRSLQTLLCHYRGPRVTQSRLHAGQDVSHWALRFLTTTAVWTAMVHISYLCSPVSFFKTYALEELESSVDELLFRLSVLSNTMQHTLRDHGYREEASPVISASPPSSHMETQVSQTCRHFVKDYCPLSQVEAEIQTTSEGTDEVLKMKNWLASSEPTSLKRFMAEDICDNRPELQTRANGSCWFIKTHSKVVEALVHNEPGTVES